MNESVEPETAHKWTTLVHHGVLLPPPYTPHGIPVLFNGTPVPLTPLQEEVATMYAVTPEEWRQHPVFRANFWRDWSTILTDAGRDHETIKSLEGCDFSLIEEHCRDQKDARRRRPQEDKLLEKHGRDKLSSHFGTAMVDGRPVPVIGYQVEPTGLFRGRGEHPKMGCVKRRKMPEDITLNVAKDAPTPPVPVGYEGHHWGTVVCRPDVSWIACWDDGILGARKYAFLDLRK